MNIWGILIGLAAFLLIGIFHPIVIKCEYHFGAKIWPLFLVAGVLCFWQYWGSPACGVSTN